MVCVGLRHSQRDVSSCHSPEGSSEFFNSQTSRYWARPFYIFQNLPVIARSVDLEFKQRTSKQILTIWKNQLWFAPLRRDCIDFDSSSRICSVRSYFPKHGLQSGGEGET